MRNVARQTLLLCRQKDGESVNAFTERLTRAVKAATVGLSDTTVREIMLDQFMDRLSPDISFHVCDAEPSTFEEAHLKALHVENLLEARKRARSALHAESTIDIKPFVAGIQHGQQSLDFSETVAELNRIKVGLEQIMDQQKTLNVSRPRTPDFKNPPASSRPNRMMDPPRRNYYDPSLIRQGRRFERNFDTRPYCTYCHKLGHLAYNCYQRVPPASIRSPRYPTVARRSPRDQYQYPQSSRSANNFGNKINTNKRYDFSWNSRSNDGRNSNMISLENQTQASQNTSSSALTCQLGVCVQHPIPLKDALFPKTQSNLSKPLFFQRQQVSSINQVMQSLHDSVADIPQVYSLTLQTLYFEQHRKLLNGVSLISSNFLSFLPWLIALLMRTANKFVKWLPVILILLIGSGSFASMIIPSSPLLCQVAHSCMFWKLPTTFSCPQANFSGTKHLQKVPLTIYRPNTIRYETTAFACRIVHKRIYYYTNIFNVKFTRTESQNLMVTKAMCKQMVNYKFCEHGNMELHGEIYQTRNSLDFEFPLPIIGSFAERFVEAINCYMFETLVTAYFEGAIASPVGDLRGCSYAEGDCLL